LIDVPDISALSVYLLKGYTIKTSKSSNV